MEINNIDDIKENSIDIKIDFKFNLESESNNEKESETIININSSGNTLHYVSQLNNIEENCCLVCLDNIENEDLEYYKIECGHKFCKECWLNYLEEKIKTNEDILCMEKTCLKIIKEEIIKNFLKDNQILLEKYEKFLIRKEVYKNPNKKFCPFPNCDGIGIIRDYKSKNNKFIECTKGHKFCFFCLKDWHKGKKCKEDIIDKNLKKYIKENNSKRCPNCGILVIKISGCNHMTCKNCEYEFC